VRGFDRLLPSRLSGGSGFDWHQTALAAVAVAALLGGPLLRPATTARAADRVLMPFPGGQRVRIIQGHHGGTHQGRSRLGLDLMLARGSTSGAPVVAPIAGRIESARAPGTGNGCVTILADDGIFAVMLCHVQLDRAFKRGEPVALGERLGTVGPPGTLGNNGTPHVHMELHRRQGARGPVPFSPPDGLPLEGTSLPSTGRSNEHGTLAPITSSNRNVGPDRVLVAAAPATGGQTSASLARAPAAAARPLGAGPAVVQGVGTCLNVRQAPGLTAAKVECLAEGSAVVIAEGPKAADGHAWYRLDGRGWASAQYLRAAAAPAAPAPPAA